MRYSEPIELKRDCPAILIPAGTPTILPAGTEVQITQSLGTDFRELVVFTPPHGRSVCLEPYTCVTDAANLAQQTSDTGWRELPPGASAHLWFEITLGPILC